MNPYEEKIKGLKEQAALLQRKLNLIRKKRPLEDDPTRSLKLEIDEEETIFQLVLFHLYKLYSHFYPKQNI